MKEDGGWAVYTLFLSNSDTTNNWRRSRAVRGRQYLLSPPENLTRDGSNSPNSLLGHFCHDRLSLAPFSSTLNFIIRRIHLRHAIRLLSLP